MNKTAIKQIFLEAGLGDVSDIQKVDVGFMNDIYSVDDKYILKVSKVKENNALLRKDIRYCGLFKGKLPVPDILYTNAADELAEIVFFIYHKIQGDNLYDVWHEADEYQRRSYIEQICGMLKILNKMPCGEFEGTWQSFIYSQINDGLKELEKQDLLPEDLIASLREFLDENKSLLEEARITLVDWDIHFDNFLVSDGRIVGFLDFEWCKAFSLDYQMVLVKRMVRNPKKYASEYAEQFVVKEDYAKLLDWYQEFYPEMFDFKGIENRLNLYAIVHCIGGMLNAAPNVEKHIEEIKEYLN